MTKCSPRPARSLPSPFSLSVVPLALIFAIGANGQQPAYGFAPSAPVSLVPPGPVSPALGDAAPQTREFSSSVVTAEAADCGSDLPNAPDPQSADQTPVQTKRILGIIPNFRAVSANQKLPPQTVHDKFVIAAQDSFDYSAVFLPSLVAWYDYERDATPEFGTGGVGYSRYLWHSAVDQTIENMMVEFFVPAVAHQDTRFYTLGSGGFVKRSGYALSRVVITRSDHGNKVFNASEVVGAGAAAGLSNLYYPRAQRTFSNTVSSWGLNVGIDAATFVFKEFWPDINHAVFHGSGTPSSTQAAAH